MLHWWSRRPHAPRLSARGAEDPDTTAALAEAEALLDRIAAEVVRRGMATPAVLFIELNRPLSFLAGQAAHVLFPFLAPVLGVRLSRQVAELLEDPANVDRLLERLERLAVSSQRSEVSDQLKTSEEHRPEPKAGR